MILVPFQNLYTLLIGRKSFRSQDLFFLCTGISLTFFQGVRKTEDVTMKLKMWVTYGRIMGNNNLTNEIGILSSPVAIELTLAIAFMMSY